MVSVSDDRIYSCPKCGSAEVSRDSFHNGVSIIYGPYGCADCRWSEWEMYALSNGRSGETDTGGRIDQWGGYIPPRSPRPGEENK